MNLHFVPIPLGRLPLHLICLSNGKVAIQPMGPFGELLDLAYEPTSVCASFYPEGFSFTRVDGAISDETFTYGEQIEYKTFPLLLKWLQQQNLENPFPPKETN